MIILRLFKASDPFREIASHLLSDGDLLIGRDAAADWVVDDDTGRVSRRHCVLSLHGGRIFLRDLSTNGMTIGADRQTAPPGERCEIVAGDTLYIGDFMILLDTETSEEETEPEVPATPERAVKAPVQSPSGVLTDAALLEAFCGGAGLEASSFAGEDPAEMMARLGVVYRQVIDDLCAMMRDRATLKDQLRLDRTTIAGSDNNPLKWSPPGRIAVELLQDGDTGFLKGAAAFRASFSDLRRHGVCMQAGSDEAIRFVLEQLAPDRLEADARQQIFPFISRFEAAWKLFRTRHCDFADGKGDAAIGRAFREGYQRRLGSIEDEEQAA